MGPPTSRCEHGLVPQFCIVCEGSVRQAGQRARTNASGPNTPTKGSDHLDHSWEEWFEMCDIGAGLIIDCARRQELIDTSEFWSGIRSGLNRDIGYPVRQLPSLLEHISDRTYESLGLLIIALVIDPSNGGPSETFFRLAVSRRLLPEEFAPEAGRRWTGMTSPQRMFWVEQVKRIFSSFSGYAR